VFHQGSAGFCYDPLIQRMVESHAALIRAAHLNKSAALLTALAALLSALSAITDVAG